MQEDKPEPQAVRATWTPTHADAMTIWTIVGARGATALEPSHYQFWTLSVLAVVSIAAGFVAVALHAVAVSNGAYVALLCGASYYATRFVEGMLFKRAVWRLDLKDVERYIGLPRSIEVDVSGVRVQGADVTFAYPWSKIDTVNESRGMLLFWVGWRSPIAVPRRAFADDDLERVRAMARQAVSGGT